MSKSKGRKTLNWRIIESNVKEAREQLEKIEACITGGNRLSEGELYVELEHAWHHINFAWKARRATLKQDSSLTDKMFNTWSKAPKDFEEYKV